MTTTRAVVVSRTNVRSETNSEQQYGRVQARKKIVQTVVTYPVHVPYVMCYQRRENTDDYSVSFDFQMFVKPRATRCYSSF